MLHVYDSYSWLRGFSVVPSWGARIEEAWWSYNGKRMREEVALARTVHANCIRLWIEYTAWMAEPEKVTTNFLDAVAAIAEAGMKTMPCLFNRWHDDRFDYGGTYLENILKGWKPHLDYVRAQTTRYYSELLSAAGFGWIGWALREGKAISARRDRYDGNGINGEGFHPFFTKEGKLRGGLEFLAEKPKVLAPWERS